MAQEIGAVANAAARLWARGIVGVVTLALALAACYGLLALGALLPLVGMRLALDEAAWAAAIVALALLTVVAVLPGVRRHRSYAPGGAALAGGGLILYALLVDYHVLVELAGFVLLTGAVGADARLRRRARRRMAHTAAGVGWSQGGGWQG